MSFIFKQPLSPQRLVIASKAYSCQFFRICTSALLSQDEKFQKEINFKNYSVSSSKNRDDFLCDLETDHVTVTKQDKSSKIINFKKYADDCSLIQDKFSVTDSEHDTVNGQHEKFIGRENIDRYSESNSYLLNEDEFSECGNKYYHSSEACYEIDDYDAITDGDPQKLKILKLFQLELDMMAQKGEKVPNRVRTHQWRELMYYENLDDRLFYLRYLWLNETKDVNKKNRQRIKGETFFKQQKEIPQREWQTNGPIIYNLQYNTLFFRLNRANMHKFYNYKLFQATMFGSTLIVDMDFEKQMKRHEMHLCAKQLLLLWSENRLTYNPFHLVFCNVNMEISETLSKLEVTIPNLFEIDFPFFHTSKSYLDLYPKNKLIYLVKQSRNEMSDYDHNSVYILGGYVCKSDVPFAFAKAKKEKLRTIKFPIDKYLKWQTGKKTLTMNQSLSILNDVKNGEYWHYAFRHVPRRKLQSKDASFLGSLNVEKVQTVLRKDNEAVYSLLKQRLTKYSNNGKNKESTQKES